MEKQSLEAAIKLVSNVPDPEIPVVTLADLGILREVRYQDDVIVVTLTPTYSGCPATEAIRTDVKKILADAGYIKAMVQITLNPAWTTRWITESGRQKLLAYGIAPPQESIGDKCLVSTDSRQTPNAVVNFKAPDRGVRCPRCNSVNTEKLSQFGSTPCKALYRCVKCREPFDYFKPF
jgi:ring-1,2-phenylacetyl-CoA epoxidase subunit PaaD